MTFKDLQKRIQTQENSQSSVNSTSDYTELLEDCQGIKFWLDISQEEHKRIYLEKFNHKRGNSKCCFWHLIGAPVKHNEEKPLFDYQQITINALEYFKKIRIKKFRGAGLTELFLRYPAWLCLSTNNYRNKKAFIITGITQELANDHILRLRNLFLPYYPSAIQNMDYTQKTLTINDSLFRAYPAANPEAPRGKTDVFFILADEFDHHTRRQQEDIMSVITPYRPKTDTLIVLNSTTKNPQGLYSAMDKEWSDFLQPLGINKANIDYHDLLSSNAKDYIKTLREKIKHHYFLLEFDYHWGLGKIYTQNEIDEVQEDRTFRGEFCLDYVGQQGNIFSPLLIDKAIELGNKYKDLPVNQYCLHIVGLDFGFGSSTTSMVVTEHNREIGLIRVMHTKVWEKPNPAEIADYCHQIYRTYKNTWLLVDGSNRAGVNQLKTVFGESLEWEPEDCTPENMKIIPVNFSTTHKEMLSHLYLLMNRNLIAIPSEHDKLILSLRSAVADEYTLDKDETNYDDLLDALRLSVRAYKIKTKE